jgi:hypothetical protein
MMAALPDKPLATLLSLRHVLVLCKAAGWVHTSIPLAAKMVEYLGHRMGAWMTTIKYDSAVVTAENLKQYDSIFLDSTTGEFLDEPNDKATTDARKQALLDFVKGGKGLAGIHAATDSYHTHGRSPEGKGRSRQANRRSLPGRKWTGRHWMSSNRKQLGLMLVGSEHWVAVSPERDPEPARRFGCFATDLREMARWLIDKGVRSVAMQSTGVYFALSSA